MAAAWMFTDSTLQAQLEAWLASIRSTADWKCRLFVNDYTPVPTSTEPDFTEASFAGYLEVTVDASLFPTPTVTDHVAISTSTQDVSFEADATGVSPQTVYGYYVVDDADNLVYAERWTDSYNITNGVKLDLVLKFKHKTATP